jgi:transcriptional regulator with XRE-family HTH domain
MRLPRKTMMQGKPRITSAQIRAARALLNWSARELSQRAGVSQSTIHRAEKAAAMPNTHQHGLAAIKSTFERCGVEFLDDSAVRLSAYSDRVDAQPREKRRATQQIR